jgi:hypothetical protein
MRGPECGRLDDAWSASRFIPYADGKARRVPLEPAFQPLVDARDGARNRVGILRAAGNSICVPTAATFLRAVMDL